MVRRARLVAARASARTAGKGPRRPLRALDRPDRRRQDAGRIFADAGGVECFRFLIAAALFSPPPAQRRGGGGGGGGGRAPPRPPGGVARRPPPPPPPPPPPGRRGRGEGRALRLLRPCA